MKILSNQQIREADAYTIEHEPITSIDLMERASKAFVTWFTQYFTPKEIITVVCGTGNNGGDGLAISRLLSEKGFVVKTVILNEQAKRSQDFSLNLKRLSQISEVNWINQSFDFTTDFLESTLLIDAIFGSGLSRAAEGLYAEIIEIINQSHCTVISVDIPSGMFTDSTSKSIPMIVADHVLTFQSPKLAFFVAENYAHIKQWHLADIGLHSGFIDQLAVDFEYLQAHDIGHKLVPRGKFSHKGNFGHVLMLAGSIGKIGAAMLTSKAILRTGSGLLTCHLPACGYIAMQTALPEAMVSVDDNEHYLSGMPDLEPYDAIGVGPGLGTAVEIEHLLQQLFTSIKCPLVIDADAINVLAKNQLLRKTLPKGAVLTPHPGEFKRLAGSWANDFEKLALQRDFARQHQVVVVLKGAYTSIANTDGTLYFNSTGNPGMATGGSGDVLTGIIASLLGQGYPALDAALIGVYLHGLAGDLAAGEQGEISLIASDIVDKISDAFRQITLM